MKLTEHKKSTDYANSSDLSTSPKGQGSSQVHTIVGGVEADLGGLNPYFKLLRFDFVDDLMRIRDLHRGGAILEIGGYPFYFSMCLRKLGIDLMTVDLAPYRAQDLIRKHSLRVIQCDIEREHLPFEDHSIATITLCATFEHLRVDPLFALEEMRRVLQPDGLLYLTTPTFTGSAILSAFHSAADLLLIRLTSTANCAL